MHLPALKAICFGRPAHHLKMSLIAFAIKTDFAEAAAMSSGGLSRWAKL
jgi:hypothetical protein